MLDSLQAGPAAGEFLPTPMGTGPGPADQDRPIEIPLKFPKYLEDSATDAPCQTAALAGIVELDIWGRVLPAQRRFLCLSTSILFAQHL